jgi:hypothetical protein
MRPEGLRRGAHIKIFVEHQVRGDRMRQLDEMALGALDDGKRAMKFGLSGVFFAREIVRKRLGTEIQKGLPKQRVAITAILFLVLFVFHKFQTSSNFQDTITKQ